MNKLELLLERCPEIVENFVNTKYDEIFKRKDKTIFHFKALGKIYDSDVFTNNYINFLKDVSKIHGCDFFEKCIPNSFVSKSPYEFSDSKIKRRQVVNVSENFYVSTYSSTEAKISHIKNICNMLGANMIEL